MREHNGELMMLLEISDLLDNTMVMYLGEEKVCQEWDSNPRLQSRLRPERSALDRSAILTYVVFFNFDQIS